jgi:hypothetical protein
MAKLFAGSPEMVETTAKRNSTLQGAYLIIAARALGLDCGPMSGFDQAKVDEEFFAAGKPCFGCDQEFFPEGHVKSNFLCNLGYGDPGSLHPRLLRLPFNEACSDPPAERIKLRTCVALRPRTFLRGEIGASAPPSLLARRSGSAASASCWTQSGAVFSPPSRRLSLLLMSTNRIQSSLLPRGVLGELIRRTLPMVHHRRVQEAGFRQGHMDVERLDFVP